MLVLLLVACTLSASLPGVWAAHPGPPDPSAQPAANLDPADQTDYAALEPVGNASPTPTDVPTYTVPPPSDSAPRIGPTEAPTKTPTKAPPTKPPPSKNYTFVALGDSLTYGYGDPGPSWPVRVDAKDAQLRLLHNAGVNGDTTAQMRARLNSVFAYKPDMLFVMGGTNDIGHNISITTAVSNLKAIVVAAQAKGIQVILMTIPPTSYPYMTDAIDTLNAQIAYIGKVYKLVVADVHTPLSAAGGLYDPRYTSDGLHFSTLGTQVVANAIFKRCQAARF